MKLLELAKERFREDWTAADEKLFAQTAKGEVAHFGDGDPAESDKWGPERVLKANRIEWLFADRGAGAHVTKRGVQLEGARFAGAVHLRFTSVDFPLHILRSAIPDGINLRHTHLRALNLNGTHTGPIEADGVQVTAYIFLRDGFRANGEVLLLGATIGGDLDCQKGHFSNPGGDALSADGADVRGAVFLNHGFHAEGAVRLLGAVIGGDLSCGKAYFSNPNGNTLWADRANVKGGVFLTNGTRATGEVRLLGATIGGNLECDKAHFSNPSGNAISADGVSVRGSVFLRGGFRAEGAVRLIGATIDGSLECSGGHFSNSRGDALIAQRADVKGDVVLADGLRAEGRVDFIGASVGGSFQWRRIESPELCTLRLDSAQIGTLWDQRTSWPRQIYLDGMVYDRLATEAPLDSESRLKWLRRAGYGEDKFVPQPYVQLAKVLHEMGHERDSRRILIEKERARRQHGGLNRLAVFGSWLLDVTIGYGYRTHRALGVLTGFLLLGTLLFFLADGAQLICPSKEGVYLAQGLTCPDDVPEAYPVFSAFVYSLDTLVPLVDLHQQNYWLPNANRGSTVLGVKTGAWVRVYLWIHILSGWLFTTLGVAGLTSLVRK